MWGINWHRTRSSSERSTGEHGPTQNTAAAPEKERGRNPARTSGEGVVVGGGWWQGFCWSPQRMKRRGETGSGGEERGREGDGRFCTNFENFSVLQTMKRYRECKKDVPVDHSLEGKHLQHLKEDVAETAKKIEAIEVAKRKLLGEGLGLCTIEELQQIEQQLERSVSKVRARKMQVLKEQVDQFKEKEKTLEAENAMLCEKLGIREGLGEEVSEERERVASTKRSEYSTDVETGLFIGSAPIKELGRIFKHACSASASRVRATEYN
ncbi:hypothetical protein RHSIM_Rhsim01G0160500 [Rhododendron simsii]|uniref:K-box domain-containing protein n=1 Tax=Rhododendron simsii TaxID=118357 RepID=A0A834LWF3_RHOSS|nr:hypothetical protein RHSIM_Rhsim01G0160500 [Rhododendron simsii]